MRQALDLSIDREAINQVVFNGEFKPGNQWVSSGPIPITRRLFRSAAANIEKAKALLKEAGVKTPPISVDFMVPKGTEYEAVAQVVQSMAAEAGFDIKIRVVEFATSLKQAQAGNFQVFYAQLERTHRSRRQLLHLHAHAALRRTMAANRKIRKPTSCWRTAAHRPITTQRKAIYEKLTKIVLKTSRSSISFTAAS